MSIVVLHVLCCYCGIKAFSCNCKQPTMKMANHFLSLLWRVVSIIYCIMMCQRTVPNALLMSTATSTMKVEGLVG